MVAYHLSMVKLYIMCVLYVHDIACKPGREKKVYLACSELGTLEQFAQLA